MFLHTSLPENVRSLLKKPKRKIVFTHSSENQPCLASQSTQVKQDQPTQSKSNSREKSIHRISSKQKPQMSTPDKKVEPFFISTVRDEPEPIRSGIFSRTPKKSHKHKAQKYYNVSELLKQNQRDRTQETNSSLNGSFLKQKTEIKHTTDSQRLSTTIRKIENIKKRLFVEEDQKADDTVSMGEVSSRSKYPFKNCWDFYQGECLENDQRHGYGALHFRNGDRFVGQFRHNQIQGFGTYYLKTGAMVHGLWSKGELIQEM